MKRTSPRPHSAAIPPRQETVARLPAETVARLPAGTVPLPRRRATSVVLAAALASNALPALPQTSTGTPVPPAQSLQTKFSGEPVTLNFVNADIEGVTRAMSAILRQQFIVDPRVKGNITVYSEQALSPREAYLNFLAALRGLGFTVVEAGGLYKVVPEADAKLQTATVSIGEGVSRRGDQVLTQIFTLNHENANNLVPVLRPLISPNNTINANPGNNTLVITDYADNLQRMAKIIAAMDTSSIGEIEVVPLRYGIASDMAAMVQRLAEPSSNGAAPAPGNAAGASVLVDTRNNALIVRAPNVARLASIKAIIAQLDRPMTGSAANGNIWVVYLKNADAVKLATVLRAAYSNNGGSGGGGASGSSPNTPGQSLGGLSQNAANGSTLGGNSSLNSANATPLASSAAPSTGGFIQADPATNSLIITAAEPLYRQLRSVIDQLDSRRAQVYIESMIVQVNASKLAEFGVQWQGGAGNNPAIIGGTNFNDGSGSNIIGLTTGLLGSGSTTTSSTSGLSLGQGLNVGLVNKFFGRYALSALAHLLETKVDGNILSTPNLVSLDNEEARIIIGQNVPFITGSYATTTTGTNTASPFQTIERQDVGLTLKIKPQIGENGTVRMTIYQENSSVSSNSSAGPTTDKSAIETNVVVDDGQIMVLGGLLKDQYTGSIDKIPYLSDIPIIGNLFKSDTRQRQKTNLMVFLRPVVLRTQDAANSLSLDRYESIRALQKDGQPQHNVMIPVNEAPVLPPIRPLDLPNTDKSLIGPGTTDPNGPRAPVVGPIASQPGRLPDDQRN